MASTVLKVKSSGPTMWLCHISSDSLKNLLNSSLGLNLRPAHSIIILVALVDSNCVSRYIIYFDVSGHIDGMF